ncbi:50S ribosomal protein L28 [Nocardiopsis aegyptia]|uniref:Large ribosomal subunit protein bL28 n=1 Tax=Nocardiopsis aegyptia TaxID=220378 RepID=A0A7Z0ESK4_9ACTN|nr:50S ribosomal protein L28 [Nocardiopsis aegyptia]NYJ36966.1 large subunit ribosomal protein L28 [Nocardiopsis aegyptia]
MSRVCQVTGKAPSFGNAVSHSHRRTRRRFDPNIQSKRYWLPSENRFVRLRLSTKGMRVIDARGIERVVAQIRARGEKV